MIRHYENQYSASSRKKKGKLELPYDLAILLLECIPNNEARTQSGFAMSVFIAALLTTDRRQK